MNKSYKWIHDFIQDEILAIKSSNDDLVAKSIGEFTIFCYLLKRQKPLYPEYIKLLEYIDTENLLYDFHNPFLKDCLNDIQSEVSSKLPQGLEVYYIKSLFYNEPQDWQAMLANLLNQVNTKGITLDTTYYLTHILFYSTNFGSEMYWDKNKVLKNICLEILLLCEEIYKKDKNWDVLREVYMCQMYLNPDYTLSLCNKIAAENKSIKSEYGWYLSDGDRLNYYEQYYPLLSLNEKYSLYHTTVISLLLEAQLNYTHQNKNISKIATV